MNKRTTKKIQPEQKLNSELKDDGLQVSPAIANALVIGSQSHMLIETGIDYSKSLNCKPGIFSVTIKNTNSDEPYNPKAVAVYSRKND